MGAAWGRIRNAIYDVIITNMTAEWYRRVLNEVGTANRLLDIGIGNGTVKHAIGCEFCVPMNAHRSVCCTRAGIVKEC